MFALVVGIMLIVFSGAAYAYVTVTMGDDPGQETPDPGAAACERLLAAYEAGDDSTEPVPAIIAGLKESANTDLQDAGEAIERLSALPEEQQAAALPEILTAMSQLDAGCAAVGVPLPAEMTGAQPGGS